MKDATAGPVKRIFSARVLERMADDPLHNFPQSLGDVVLTRGARTVKSKDYVEYTLRGVANEGLERTRSAFGLRSQVAMK
jgi:hypothetical protein